MEVRVVEPGSVETSAEASAAVTLVPSRPGGCFRPKSGAQTLSAKLSLTDSKRSVKSCVLILGVRE